MFFNGFQRSKRDIPFVAVNNGNSSVRVRQLVMVPPTLIDKSGLFQSLYEFVCCHEIFIRIMRIAVKENIYASCA